LPARELRDTIDQAVSNVRKQKRRTGSFAKTTDSVRLRPEADSYVSPRKGIAGDGYIFHMPMSSEEWQFLKASITRMEQIVSAMKELQALTLPEDARKIIARNLEAGESLVKELRHKTAN
jgi:hypothetical protein